MAGLPFVVQPRLKPIMEQIGSEESGKIEIERRGYLTSGEKAFYQQVRQNDPGTTRLISLARKAAVSSNVDLTQAYEAVTNILGGGKKEDLERNIEKEYAEEIAEVLKELANGQVNEDLLMAACMIRYRINSDYGMDKIMDLHPDIISGLSLLYREEDAKSVERLVENQPNEKINVEKIAKKSTSKVMPTA
jgi:hypothetical protein